MSGRIVARVVAASFTFSASMLTLSVPSVFALPISAVTSHAYRSYEIRYEGVQYTVPKPNESDSFASRAVDLDALGALPGTQPSMDITLLLNVTITTWWFIPAQGKIALDDSNEPPSQARCQALLQGPTASMQMRRAPTKWYCVRTHTGIARIRIGSARVINKPQNFIDVVASLQYELWPN
jgi:hypothetical protein